jgi:hypothetical protein
MLAKLPVSHSPYMENSTRTMIYSVVSVSPKIFKFLYAHCRLTFTLSAGVQDFHSGVDSVDWSLVAWQMSRHKE